MLFRDQGTLTQRSTVFMYSVCKQTFKKKYSHWAKVTNWKPKWNCIIYFYIVVKIQRKTVARKRCNLTLNLCTKGCVQKMKKHIRKGQDSGSRSRPERNFYQMNKPTLLDFKVMGGYLFLLFFFPLFFGVLDNLCISFSSFSKSCSCFPSCKEMTEW